MNTFHDWELWSGIFTGVLPTKTILVGEKSFLVMESPLFKLFDALADSFDNIFSFLVLTSHFFVSDPTLVGVLGQDIACHILPKSPMRLTARTTNSIVFLKVRDEDSKLYPFLLGPSTGFAGF